MTAGPWLIYGAYGYTGQRIAREAVRRGARPILAGRDEAKLRSVGDELGCPVVPTLAHCDRIATCLLAQRSAEPWHRPYRLGACRRGLPGQGRWTNLPCGNRQTVGSSLSRPHAPGAAHSLGRRGFGLPHDR